MKKIMLVLLPFILLGLYIGIASFQLSSPGLQYDEVLFTNAALGPIDNTFVDVKIGSFPIMLMSYIGALKAYIYYPIFKLFGVSVFTIRFPMIFLSAIGLYILYRFVLHIFGKKTAIVVLLLSFLDPIFISQTRFDMGPAVLSYFCKTSFLYAFFLFLKEKKWHLLFITCLFLFLGLYNKLNFIWFGSAFFISAFIFYRNTIFGFFQNSLSKQMQKILIGLSIFVLLLGLYGMIKSSFLDSIDFFYFKHLLYVIEGLIFTLNGQLFLRQTLEMGSLITPPHTVVGWIVVFVIGLSIAIRLFTRFKNKEEQKSFYFLFFIVAITYFQLIITNISGKSWHFFEMYPLTTLLFGISLASLIKNKTILSFLIFLFLVYQGFTYSLYIKSYQHPDISPAWSTDIYSLIDFTKSQNRTFISMDWGIHNQLQTFDHIKGKYTDGWIYAGKEIPADFYKPQTLILFHTKDKTFMELPRVEYVKHLPPSLSLTLNKTIGMYEVWEVRKRVN